MCSKQNRRFKFECFQNNNRINKSEILKKHISSGFKCKFDGKKWYSNQI